MRALLDRATGEITLPLDEYDLVASWENLSLINRGRNIAMARCMGAAGHTYGAAGQIAPPESNPGDRTYGLWDSQRARQYGFGMAASPVAEALREDELAGGDAWLAAAEKCSTDIESEVASFTPTNDELTEGAVARLRTEAYQAALADPDWTKAREEWWVCIEAEGLHARRDQSSWSSEEAASVLGQFDQDGKSLNKEEEIRVAVIESTCNEKTRLAQRLGDIEASYQAVLVRRNEALLQNVKTENQQRVQAARDYMAQNG